MKIVIDNKNNYNKYFIYNYLQNYIDSIIVKEYRYSRAKKINNSLKINTLQVFRYAIKTATIKEVSNSYVISINKNIFYDNYNLLSLINYITYGNREIKGYRLLSDVFNFIRKNINLIYNEWLDYGG